MQNPSRIATALGGRIAVVDVLRGFALFGIILTHSGMGFLAGRAPSPAFMTLTPLDQQVYTVVGLLAVGKFFTIFSFLFGLSFAIQMNNAEQKGGNFVGRFAWRLVVLGLIAAVHGMFFSGDILIIYVILGFLLIPFRKMNTKVLVVSALILIFNVPGLVLNALQLNASPPTPGQVRAMQQQQAVDMESVRRHYEIKKSGTVAEVIVMNTGSQALMGKLMFQVFSGRAWATFGLFLLGLVAGRAQIFRDTPENRVFFRKLLWGAGAVALVMTIISIVVPAGAPGAPTLTGVLRAFSVSVQWATLSAFYVALITLLYWRNPVKGWLANLAPVGKMGLTVYLTQTVFGLILFYGFGFGYLGEMGVAAAVACGIAFYVVQVFLARLWMARFSMGPVEWLWRALTYFTLRPNERSAALKPA
jgi:uncharacterized protein